MNIDLHVFIMFLLFHHVFTYLPDSIYLYFVYGFIHTFFSLKVYMLYILNSPDIYYISHTENG